MPVSPKRVKTLSTTVNGQSLIGTPSWVPKCVPNIIRSGVNKFCPGEGAWHVSCVSRGMWQVCLAVGCVVCGMRVVRVSCVSCCVVCVEGAVTHVLHNTSRSFKKPRHAHNSGGTQNGPWAIEMPTPARADRPCLRQKSNREFFCAQPELDLLQLLPPDLHSNSRSSRNFIPSKLQHMYVCPAVSFLVTTSLSELGNLCACCLSRL